MAGTPPSVKWKRWDSEGNTFIDIDPYEWNAGIVEAGSSSADDGNNEFYVWNNYNGLTDLADMINVRISVKDENGQDTNKKVCGDAGDPNKQASVGVRMFNDSKGSGGEWGYYDNGGTWNNDTAWQALTSSTPVPVTQRSGMTAVTASGGTVSGAKNRSGIDGDSRNNYIRLKLQITASGSADAGTVRWINRISYQYQ